MRSLIIGARSDAKPGSTFADRALGITGISTVGRGRASGRAANNKKETGMFQGYIDLDAATPVEATAIPDVLFERGLYWASGRSGVVNLIAAHNGSIPAALPGRVDGISLRHELAA